MSYLRRTQLTLAEKRRGPNDDRYAWLPFEDSALFSPEWWDRVPYLDDDPWFVLALQENTEVARVELDNDVHIDHYADTPNLDGSGLEIAFFEVSAAHRRQGIGSAVVQALATEHRHRRLVAFSEEADAFWSSLGWERFLHASAPERYRPLFVQPQTPSQE